MAIPETLALAAAQARRNLVLGIWGVLGWLWIQIQRLRAARHDPRPAATLGDAFLQGANLPWFSCGNDFGGNAWHPEGGISAPGRIESVQRAFAGMERDGITCLRWFLFADGRSGILSDPAGRPTGLDDRVFPDLDLAFHLAAHHGIRILPVCFDFLLCAPPQWANGVQLGGRSRWLQDPEAWEILETRVLTPLFIRYGNHPALLAWDLFNEPEWAAFGMGWEEAGIAPWTLRSRLGRMAQLAHRHGDRPVTVGLGTVRGLPLVRGLGLDVFQIHWYDRHDAASPLDRPVEQLHLDRPLLLGEFPTRNSRRSQTEIVATARRNGYCGALAWSLQAGDAFSGMGPAAPQMDTPWPTASG